MLFPSRIVPTALSSNPTKVFAMMPEDFAMFMAVFKKLLYGMLFLSSKAAGKWDEWIGGTPGISKYLF